MSSLEIIESFSLTNIGHLCLVKHHERGLPPGLEVRQLNDSLQWKVSRRVLMDVLLLHEEEVFFEVETKVEYMSHSFEPGRREEVRQRELKNRREGKYWYVLEPMQHSEKPKGTLVQDVKSELFLSRILRFVVNEVILFFSSRQKRDQGRADFDLIEKQTRATNKARRQEVLDKLTGQNEVD